MLRSRTKLALAQNALTEKSRAVTCSFQKGRMQGFDMDRVSLAIMANTTDMLLQFQSKMHQMRGKTDWFRTDASQLKCRNGDDRSITVYLEVALQLKP